MSNFEDLCPDFLGDGSPSNGHCKCSAGGIVNCEASQTRTFKWRDQKLSYHPLKVKEAVEAKLNFLALQVGKQAYQSRRKRWNSRNYLMAQNLHITLMYKKSKTGAEKREGEDSYHFL